MLRTIGNNIANTAKSADELTISVNGTSQAISLIDESTGDMKNTYDVLQNISEYWDDMTNSEKQSIAITLAGKNQFEVFTSVLSNFENAQKGVELATNSSGSAMKENEAHMDSLSA